VQDRRPERMDEDERSGIMSDTPAAETRPEQRSARVLAGYDGSPSSAVAVAWAADEAARRGVPLAVAYAADYTGLVGGPFGGAWLPEAVVRETERTAEAGAALARERQPGLEVTAHAYADGAAITLIRESRSSGLVVVGTRGRGELAACVLGSVATSVAARALAPVVVVRGGEAVTPGPQRPVVVAVDGSAAAGDALRFAVEAARGTGATLKIVGAWLTVREDWVRAYWLAADPTQDPDRTARQAVEGIVADAADTAAALAPDLTIRSCTRGGDPATVIVDLAGDDAALVVLGSRGRGSVAGLLLGSVGHGVVHAARCPVAVVKHDAGLEGVETAEPATAGATG
jgi:nucleotide-binding universal stress UspA family protein